jgi:hypothetical protein
VSELQTPAWAADLAEAQQDRLEKWLATLSPLARFRLNDVTPFAWGFAFKLSPTQRFQIWLDKFPPYEARFLLHDLELDPDGTHFILTEDHTHGAICGWDDVPKAAAHLRTHCLGPNIEATGSFRHALQILAALQVPEGQLNGTEVPSYAMVEWGPRLRLNQEKMRWILEYLCIELPSDRSTPLTVNLGANVVAVCGWSSLPSEPLRVGLCESWYASQAARDITRWLKSCAPRVRAGGSR